MGSALIRAFEDQGLTTVGLDVVPPPPGSEPSQFYLGDVRSPDWCRRLTAGCSIVVHAAASVPLARSKDVFSVNVLGSTNMAAAATDAEVFVHLSSTAVYGCPGSIPVSVNSPLAPLEPYGRSKLLAEQAVSSTLDPSTKLVILRPRTILSPERGGIFSALFDALSSGSALPVFGSSTVIQLLHVSDCVAAVLLAASPGSLPGVLNLGAHSPEPLAEHLRSLVHDTKSSAKVCVLPPRLASSLATLASSSGFLPYAPWHTKTYGTSNVVDLAESRSMGFVPKVSNYDALLDAYLSRKSLPGSSPHTSSMDSPASKILLRALKLACR